MTTVGKCHVFKACLEKQITFSKKNTLTHIYSKNAYTSQDSMHTYLNNSKSYTYHS